MATYVIGDIHGCIRTLQALLAKIDYRPTEDRIWLTGDLVNRGPDSLAVLRWAVDQGEKLVCVLGNHEIHLLGAVLQVPGFRMRSAFEPILEAADLASLLTWLRTRPLLHHENDWVMVHAGLLPAWDLDLAIGLSARCEELLPGDGAVGLLAASRNTEDGQPNGADSERGRLAEFLRTVTLLRLVDGQGRGIPAWVDKPEGGPPGSYPWFDAPGRRQRGQRVLFGHWATLGLMLREDACCLDSGCVWGGQLSALRLEDHALYQQDLLDTW